MDMGSKARGFSLVELIVTITVLAVLASLAVPSFNTLRTRSQLAVVTNELLATLALARSEALKLNTWVTACTSPDGALCNPGVDWHEGWIVFVDRNRNALRDADETLLSRTLPQAASAQVQGNAPVRHHVSYNSQGRTTLANGGLQMGTLSVCVRGKGRNIVINAAGRPRVEEFVC